MLIKPKVMTTDQILKQIGKNIKRIREDQGILQQDLAAICNFETSTMSRIEAGGSNFTISTLHKIATALKIPICDLFA